MIRGGFLSNAERLELRALARDGLSEARAARRANAIILRDKGWSCQEVAEALLIDDDTGRSWHKLDASKNRLISAYWRRCGPRRRGRADVAAYSSVISKSPAPLGAGFGIKQAQFAPQARRGA